MIYDCELLPMTKIHVGQNKVIKPLCTTCENIQCDNPIVKKRVSVFGTVGEVRLYEMADGYHMVKSCPGYMEEFEE